MLTSGRSFDNFLPIPDLKKLFMTVNAAEGPEARRDHAWMRLLLFTGFKPGSLCAISIMDAREKRRIWRDEALEALDDLLAVRREMGQDERPTAPLLMGPDKRMMGLRLMQERLRLWVRKAGLDESITPTTLANTHFAALTCAQFRGARQEDMRTLIR